MGLDGFGGGEGRFQLAMPDGTMVDQPIGVPWGSKFGWLGGPGRYEASPDYVAPDSPLVLVAGLPPQVLV